MKYLLALLSVVLLLPGTSRADSLFLSTGNSALSGYPGNYAKLDITFLDSTHASVSLTSLVHGSNIYLFGGSGLLGLNVNGTASVSNLTGANSGHGFDSPSLSADGPKNLDGFGQFNLTINGFDGYTHTVDSLSFNLTDTSGTWGSARDVLAPNANGYLAAGHVFVAEYPASACEGALATGYAAGGSCTQPTPEPATLVLFGIGAVGLAGYAWRRRQ